MPQRLTLVIHSLEGGGAERVCVLMANEWAKMGYSVSLITLARVEEDHYEVDDRVERIGLDLVGVSPNVFAAIGNNLRRVKRLRAAIKETNPDVVISLVDLNNILTLLACKRLDVEVIVCEHIDPRPHDAGRVWSALRNHTYPRCRALTVLTSDVVEYARRFVKGRPIYCVPNAVPSGFEPAPPDRQETEPTLISIGRLTAAKGFDRLIDAFSRVASRFPEWKLIILGEGTKRASLVTQIKSAGLSDRVDLPGWVPNPDEFLKRSRCYVCSSHYEGFPMVLLEAMACGLPVVSFDCQSGPADIVRHDVDGLLVEQDDVAGLASAMEQLMSDESKRAKLAIRAPDVLERFSIQKFMDRWEAILNEVSEEEYNAKFGS